MKKFIISLSILLFSLVSQTAVASEEARQRCVALFMNQCVDKCQTVNGENCTENCQGDAENQCLEAGE